MESGQGGSCRGEGMCVQYVRNFDRLFAQV